MTPATTIADDATTRSFDMASTARLSRRDLLGWALLAAAGGASADTGTYPTHSIRLIVPTPPGGGADTLARLVARKLQEQLGQPLIVENRPGAAGNTAAEYVSRQAADGYTLFIGAIAPFAISPTLYKSLPYDPIKDFTHITMGVVLANVLVAHPSLPVNSVPELIALAKARPGTINFSSSGNATAGHLAGELFDKQAGVQMVHVPYKGGGPSIMDLIAGNVQISFASPPSVMAYIKSGKLKALGVTTAKRLAALPNVPTIAESGLPGFTANNWYCFSAPAGLPPDVLSRLNGEIAKAMKAQDVRPILLEQGMEPTPSSPEELTRFVRAETEKWGEIIRERNFKAD